MGAGEGGFSRNHIPRRIHRERAQVNGRVSKHGLLEKKRDYKLRARDQNRKAKRLKLLREKARLRNPDEFYHGMIRRRTSRGVVHRDASDAEATLLQHQSKEQRLLTETQDANYMEYKMSVERGKIASLQLSTHFVDDGTKETQTPKHIVFIDDDEEDEEEDSRMKRIKKRIATARVGKTQKDEQNEDEDEDEDEDVLAELPNMQSKKACKQLDMRKQRYSQLATVFNDMSLQKKLLSKGRRTLEKPADKKTGAPPVFRWMQERKR